MRVRRLGGRPPSKLPALWRTVLVVALVAGMVGGIGGVPVAAGEPLTPDGVVLQAAEGFTDIADAGVHRANVETLANRGILEGTECAPGQFCPVDPIQRWVMAVWLVRAVDGVNPPAVGSSRFSDVEAGEWWSPYVERLADLGITRGCAVEPARYCPADPVTREQMASFLVRAFQLQAVSGNRFADVGEGNGHLADINALAEAGVTAGCATEPARYCPSNHTTRAQMATFLARALGIDSQPEETTVPVDRGSTPAEGDFTAIASGQSHTCGLLKDGSVSCWGSNHRGQAEPPGGTFTAVASGWNFSCALNTEGLVRCWGGNESGQSDAPDGRFVSIAADRVHACGVRTDQTVACWGLNDDGQADPPEGQFAAVSAGAVFSCGIRTDQTVVCWGGNNRGETDTPPGSLTGLVSGSHHSCGLGSEGRARCWGSDHGGTGAPARRFTALAAGAWHSCGIRTDQTVVCWGSNRTGQSTPPQGTFSAITAGQYHTCGIRTGGTVACWGRNPQDRQDPGEGQLTTVASGRTHSCAIRSDQRVICWGVNNDGQADPPSGQFQTVAVGNWHSCGIRTDRTVVCWGGNWAGQSDSPEGEFHSLTAGSTHSCGIRTDQTVECWGNNNSGQAQAPEGEFVSISAGIRHTCGILASRAISCWGSNRSGQANPPGGSYVTIEAGDFHSCAVRASGAIACWGYNRDGQTDPPSGGFETVTAGGDHSCATRADGSVVCWGANDHGETEAPEGQFAAASAGNAFSCGLRTNGTVTCWGRQRIVSLPTEVEFTTRWDLPDPAVCRPPGVRGDTAGFPLPGWAIPSIGAARVAVLFVDFPNAVATHSTHQEAELELPWMKQYLETVSYRQFKPIFQPLHRWLRAEHNHSHYWKADATVGHAIDQEAAGLADPEYDFTNIDLVMVVMPSSHFGGGNAGGTAKTEEGTVGASMRINTFPRDEPREPHQWGYVGAHELSHNLGLTDLYPFNRHKPPFPPAGVWVEAEFGLMGLDVNFQASEDDPRLAFQVLHNNGQRTTGHTRRLKAVEMLAWSRWQLGWLKPEQIRCVTQLETETTITISPVAVPGNEPVMIAIPTSGNEVIVIESRRKLGYDAGRDHQWSDGARTTFPALLEEGVLVYTVNPSIRGGQLPVKVAGDPGNGHLERDPILTEGETITVGDYTITVRTSAYYTDTITITKTSP